jgi:hypothetical protein
MTQPEAPIPAWDDPIVAEVRRAREALFAAADHDLDKLCDHLRAEEGRSGHRVVRHAPQTQEERPNAAP